MNKLGKALPEKIIIFRALQLGDMLCAVPALRALRKELPDAIITLVSLPWAVDFVKRFHNYLDDFIEFPGYPGLPEQPARIHELPVFIQGIQARHYDLAIQMQGSGSISNLIVALFGARVMTGYTLRGHYCPDTERFLHYPVQALEKWRHLRLMDFLGIPLQGEDLEFPLFKEDQEEFHKLSQQYDLAAGKFAVIHPGSRAIERRWPVGRFAEVANGLAERGLKVVMTGSQDEAGLVEEVEALLKYPAVNLAGKTSLGGMAALLNASRLLVCNDTGVSHIADALQIPSVILFTSSDPNRWAPSDHHLHRAISWASAAIPTQVLDEVDVLLREERQYAANH